MVSMFAVTECGQANGTDMGNAPGVTLRDAFRMHEGPDTVFVIHDTFYHGACGMGSGNTLHQIMNLEEISKIHQSGKSHLAEAFKRVIGVR